MTSATRSRVYLRSAHTSRPRGTHRIPPIYAFSFSRAHFVGCVRANYADVTQEVAQKASCLAPKTFASTLKIVKTALASNKTSNGTPSKSSEVIDPTSYATLIGEHKIGQPLRVKKWMEEAQAALVALPRFQRDFASRITESDKEVRVAVFFWVCRAIKVRTRFNIGTPFLLTLLTLPFLPSSRLRRLCRWSTSMASHSRFSTAS